MEISNFTSSQKLHVEIHQYEGTKFITMQQCAQSMRFQMDITPKEARKFAQALLRYADIAEDGNEAETFVAVDGKDVMSLADLIKKGSLRSNYIA